MQQGLRKGKATTRETTGNDTGFRGIEGLCKNPGFIGFHLCGAYQRNKARRRGLLDDFENPDLENVRRIQAANEEVTRWMTEKS